MYREHSGVRVDNPVLVSAAVSAFGIKVLSPDELLSAHFCFPRRDAARPQTTIGRLQDSTDERTLSALKISGCLKGLGSNEGSTWDICISWGLTGREEAAGDVLFTLRYKLRNLCSQDISEPRHTHMATDPLLSPWLAARLESFARGWCRQRGMSPQHQQQV